MDSGSSIHRINDHTKVTTSVYPSSNNEIKRIPLLETSKSIFNPSTSPPVNNFMSRLHGRNILYQRK